MSDFLSVAWAGELQQRINSSEKYRTAGAKWEGGVGLLVRGEGVPVGVALDLSGGVCHGAKPIASGVPEELRLVLEGDLATWKLLLGGGMEPVSAVLRGKLKLVRGSLTELLPQAEGAKQLLLAAREIETRFRDESAPESPGKEAPVEVAAKTNGSPMRRDGFQMTSARGLAFDSPPMRLFEKAKRDGIWNPAEIDFSQDRRDWLGLDDGQRDLLLRLAALFGAGEESVVLDLLPLISVVAQEGRLEEEIFLTSFLWEEAKHVEAFRRFFDQVAEERSDLSHYHSPSYRKIFCEELPEAMGRLRTDHSVEAQATASTTYNLIVEGVLAETGYFTYYRLLADNGILPGMQRVVKYLQADESRHLAYGVYLLSRLVAEHGDRAWHAVEAQMNRLIDPALGVIREAFDAYDPEHVPFDLELEPFLAFAQDQFGRRMVHIERARGRRLEEVLGESPEASPGSPLAAS